MRLLLCRGGRQTIFYQSGSDAWVLDDVKNVHLLSKLMGICLSGSKSKRRNCKAYFSGPSCLLLIQWEKFQKNCV